VDFAIIEETGTITAAAVTTITTGTTDCAEPIVKAMKQDTAKAMKEASVTAESTMGMTVAKAATVTAIKPNY